MPPSEYTHIERLAYYARHMSCFSLLHKDPLNIEYVSLPEDVENAASLYDKRLLHDAE